MRRDPRCRLLYTNDTGTAILRREGRHSFHARFTSGNIQEVADRTIKDANERKPKDRLAGLGFLLVCLPTALAYSSYFLYGVMFEAHESRFPIDLLGALLSIFLLASSVYAAVYVISPTFLRIETYKGPDDSPEVLVDPREFRGIDMVTPEQRDSILAAFRDEGYEFGTRVAYSVINQNTYDYMDRKRKESEDERAALDERVERYTSGVATA